MNKQETLIHPEGETSSYHIETEA